MPFFVADYLADTGHLTTIEHGAYMLLIMHYWANDGLPTDEKKLSRIARMSESEWRESRDTIAEFFSADWKHDRIEFELAESNAAYARRAAAGRKGGNARPKRKPSGSNASTLPELPHPQPHTATEPKGSAAVSTPPPSDLKKSCEEAAGASYPRGFGLIEEAAASGISVQDRILPVIRETAAFARKRGKTIDSWAFFEKPIKDSAVHTHAPPGKGGKTWVKIGTPQFDAWNVWYQDTQGKSAPQSRKGGWYFPSEFPPGVSFPASDVREERVKT